MNPDSVFNFSSRNVLVVGASRAGIGSAIAASFKAGGADVTITGVEPEPAEADRGRYRYMQINVTDASDIADLAAETDELDVLVNCAAITSRGEEMDPEFFGKVIDVNLEGTFRMSSAFLEHLKRSQGNVINIASMYASFGSPMNPAYGASKAAVRQLTKSLAMAWAQFNIRVNCIAPGFIITEQSAKSRTNSSHVEAVNARTPMGRWGAPEDLAGPALFLASPAASFMTGTCLSVDGGYSVA
ncbi:SDR family NAD(P)-dependent oxidoreductase [Hoeflea prorocentri]|uniref:SDR family oxidoreductase n=1 Tax=Hoeflea prorocentri TaxID=1922333 RepID=A0A9X3UJM2_9HYPH|nr:SDR family oxidoreductase [Hoeflea prorocentri]MCY6381791.1 SDR family oxidoreductase [Hoeflea prorocentri]MDA5399591.1 SDR family oxidoreductase [Hoeflea prorocentri]